MGVRAAALGREDEVESAGRDVVRTGWRWYPLDRLLALDADGGRTTGARAVVDRDETARLPSELDERGGGVVLTGRREVGVFPLAAGRLTGWRLTEPVG